MDKGPGHGHRYQRETRLEVLQAPVRVAGSEQHDPDGDQAGDRCSQQNHVSQIAAGALALGVARGGFRVEPPHRGPHPGTEDHCQDVPADQGCGPARSYRRSGCAANDRCAKRHQQFRAC